MKSVADLSGGATPYRLSETPHGRHGGSKQSLGSCERQVGSPTQ